LFVFGDALLLIPMNNILHLCDLIRKTQGLGLYLDSVLIITCLKLTDLVLGFSLKMTGIFETINAWVSAQTLINFEVML
jgi:hypothetical protein